MEAVLNHGVKVSCCWRILVVVGAAFGIDVSDLLPDAPFACTDRADPFEQFAEVVNAEDSRSLLQSFVVEHKALAYILVENLCSPLTKACRAGRRHTVADRDYHVKIVKIHFFLRLHLGYPYLRLLQFLQLSYLSVVHLLDIRLRYAC